VFWFVFFTINTEELDRIKPDYNATIYTHMSAQNCHDQTTVNTQNNGKHFVKLFVLSVSGKRRPVFHCPSKIAACPFETKQAEFLRKHTRQE